MSFLLTCVQLGLYDSGTGLSLTPESVLDISDMSPLGQKCMIVYATAQRGKLVKVILYWGDQYKPQSTVETHWFVDDLDAELQASDTILPRFADDLGFSPEGLVCLLKKHAGVTTKER